VLVIEGTFQAGEMVLSGVDRTPTGEERHVRGDWKAVNDGVRETAVISTDGGGGHTVYEHQEDTEQTVRVWGDTAVITAKLWEKGTDNEKPFDYAVWFSDTYVRTPSGWKYVFGQSSLPLPKPSK
jgi:putative component of toxin-antitoxin plasmid stabilization module